MRPTAITLSLAALALGTALASAPAFAQNSGRALNDGGFVSTPNTSPQQGDYYAPQTGPNGQGTYNQSFQWGDQPQPGLQMNAQGAPTGCTTRFRSYNPETGTYMGFDHHRHICR